MLTVLFINIFYFFDNGVKRALQRTLNSQVVPNTIAYGKAFEHFLIAELHRLNSYKSKDYQIYYLATQDDAEIDLIVDRPGLSTLLIEIKSTKKVDDRHVRNLKKYASDFPDAQMYCLSLDTIESDIKGIKCRQWMKGIAEIAL